MWCTTTTGGGVVWCTTTTGDDEYDEYEEYEDRRRDVDRAAARDATCPAAVDSSVACRA